MSSSSIGAVVVVAFSGSRLDSALGSKDSCVLRLSASARVEAIVVHLFLMRGSRCAKQQKKPTTETLLIAGNCPLTATMTLVKGRHERRIRWCSYSSF